MLLVLDFSVLQGENPPDLDKCPRSTGKNIWLYIQFYIAKNEMWILSKQNLSVLR